MPKQSNQAKSLTAWVERRYRLLFSASWCATNYHLETRQVTSPNLERHVTDWLSTGVPVSLAFSNSAFTSAVLSHHEFMSDYATRPGSRVYTCGPGRRRGEIREAAELVSQNDRAQTMGALESCVVDWGVEYCRAGYCYWSMESRKEMEELLSR